MRIIHGAVGNFDIFLAKNPSSYSILMKMGGRDGQQASTVDTDATSSTGAQAMSITLEQLNAIIQSAIMGALAAQANPASQSAHQTHRPEPPSMSFGL